MPCPKPAICPLYFPALKRVVVLSVFNIFEVAISASVAGTSLIVSAVLNRRLPPAFREAKVLGFDSMVILCIALNLSCHVDVSRLCITSSALAHQSFFSCKFLALSAFFIYSVILFICSLDKVGIPSLLFISSVTWSITVSISDLSKDLTFAAVSTI